MRYVLVFILACQTQVEPPPAQTTVIAGTVASIAAPVAALAEQCPAWTDMHACKQNGFIYASGKTRGGIVAEQTAANRARAALLGDKKGALSIDRSELPAAGTCGEDVVVLARAPAAKIGGDVAACDKPVEAIAPAPGCPEWTSKRTYREGDTLYVVGVLDGKINNPALAQSTLENRLRSAALQYFHFTATRTATGLEASHQGTPPPQTGSDKVECNGISYLRLAFNASP